MNKYDLGVIIPFYNNSIEAETLFKELLDKLLKQVVNEDRVLVCIVEDGQCSKWLSNYIFPNMYVERIKTNQGVSHARNVGIDLLINKCNYLSFIDSDDYISDNYIEELLNVCQDNNYEFIETKVNINGQLNDELTYNKWRNAVWGMCLKCNMINDIRFDENKLVNEDTDFMYKCLNGTKWRKYYANCIYYYNYGRNPKSLIVRYNANEIGKERK